MPATRQAESNSVTSCGCGDSMPTPPETQLPGGTRHCSRPGPRRLPLEDAVRLYCPAS
jgi:hypothetical protein